MHIIHIIITEAVGYPIVELYTRGFPIFLVDPQLLRFWNSLNDSDSDNNKTNKYTFFIADVDPLSGKINDVPWNLDAHV